MVACLVVVVDQAQTTLTPLQTVGRRVGIILLETETRARHQRMIVRNLPIETEIDTMVIVASIRVACLKERINGRRCLVPLLGTRVIHRIGVVEEVAALQCDLLAFAKCCRVVQTYGIDRCNTSLRTHHILTNATATATARCSQNILEREVLLVDIIEKSKQRNAMITLKNIDIATRQIFMVVDGILVIIVTVTGIELTELSLTHMFVGYDVQSLVSLAVVHTRELGLIAQFVIDFDTIDRLCGQRLDSSRYVLAEELLTIDKDLLDCLALSFNLTIVDVDTGHLLQQTLDVRVVRHLERTRIIAHRVALL